MTLTLEDVGMRVSLAEGQALDQLVVPFHRKAPGLLKRSMVEHMVGNMDGRVEDVRDETQTGNCMGRRCSSSA